MGCNRGGIGPARNQISLGFPVCVAWRLSHEALSAKDCASFFGIEEKTGGSRFMARAIITPNFQETSRAICRIIRASATLFASRERRPRFGLLASSAGRHGSFLFSTARFRCGRTGMSARGRRNRSQSFLQSATDTANHAIRSQADRFFQIFFSAASRDV